MRTIVYYAWARTEAGKIGQLRVERSMHDGRCVAKRQDWTGVLYRSDKAAAADVRRLNCEARR